MEARNLIKKALWKMLKDGEFDKLIKHCKKYKERKHIKDLKRAYSGFRTFEELDRVSIIVIIRSIRSPLVWQSIATYMLLV